MSSGIITTITDGFKKCGEISTALQIGKKVFAFSCIYCDEISMELNNFMAHIEELHQQQVYDQEQKLTSKCSKRIKRVKKSHKKQVISEIKIEENKDPLDECPMNLCDVKEELEDVECDDDDLPIVNLVIKLNVSGSGEDVLINDIANDSEVGSDAEDTQKAVSPTTEADEKELTLTIISAYENHRSLWGEEHAIINRRMREGALRSIAKTVNSQLGLNLTWQIVSKHIKKIRSRFLIDMENQNIAQWKGESYTPVWYYKKLSFLVTGMNTEDHKKKKQIQEATTTVTTNENPSLPLPNLTNAENRQFFEIYKSFPCLWDIDHISFRLKNKRDIAAEEMQQSLESELNFSITVDELQKYIYRIRYACTQEKLRKLHCDSIKEKFEPICEFYSDICFLEDHVTPFKCDICQQTLSSHDQFKVHKAKHTNSMPFICTVCSKGFTCSNNFKVHLRRHIGDYPHECKECGKAFATTTDLKVHIRIHTGERPYFCEICGQTFRTSSFFNSHMRRHENLRKHKCTLCPKAYFTGDILRNHMKVHLNIRDKICDVCNKTFTNSKLLRQHQQIHSEKKSYVCKICAKEFAQCAGLNSHMKSHANTRSGQL